MSNEEQQQTLTSNLKSVQERYRRRSLESRLEAVAEDLRDIKLQAVIMEKLFETEIEVDRELVEQINAARDYIRRNEYEALENDIARLEQKANSERGSIEQALSKKLVSYEDHVSAMVQINEKTTTYNQDSLNGLYSLLSEWNWREATSIEDVSDFETQLEECRSFGTDMRAIYEDARSEIIEPLADEGIEDVVESILGSEKIHLTDLSSKERERLVNSDLGDHLAIILG
jgi:hypothetical protein